MNRLTITLSTLLLTLSPLAQASSPCEGTDLSGTYLFRNEAAQITTTLEQRGCAKLKVKVVTKLLAADGMEIPGATEESQYELFADGSYRDVEGNLVASTLSQEGLLQVQVDPGSEARGPSLVSRWALDSEMGLEMRTTIFTAAGLSSPRHSVVRMERLK